MMILFILIGISLIVALFFLFMFILNVKSGQYDDMYTPSVRILFESNINNNTDDNANEKHSEKSN